MSAQWTPCAINDSPVAILSRFSLPAPRSSTWMNRKQKIFQLASENYYSLSLPSKCIKRKSRGFCHEKRQQNWQTYVQFVQFYMETVDQFRSQNGDKQYAAVLNSSNVFKQATTTSSHTPPNPQSSCEVSGSPSADNKDYWLLECNVVYSGKNTGCFTTLGHNCRRWFPRFLWSKKVHINMCPILDVYGVMGVF